MYESAAEPLPDALRVTVLEEGKESQTLWNPNLPLPEEIRELTCDVLGVTTRHLPPGRPHDLYLQFLAWWDDQKASMAVAGVCNEGVAGELKCRGAPCFNTFVRRWHGKRSRVLKFRQQSQHSCCQTCFELKVSMKEARGDLAKKLRYAQLLRAHIRAQYQDRVLYWSLRFASRQYQNVLTIIIDSMDKTRFSIPRFPFGEKPKELEGFNRPKLVCTAALAHGWCTYVCLADDDLNHGADAFAEVLLRVLEEVYKVSQATGRPMPQHLVVQADNTTAQCKNGLGTMLLALLVARYKFITASLHFLRVGHTHEDVGWSLRAPQMTEWDA